MSNGPFDSLARSLAVTRRCCDVHWVLLYAPDGGKWRLQDRDVPVLSIPDPPVSDLRRPLDVFPSLADISAQHCVAAASTPRLCATDRHSDWPEELLVRMLDLPASSIFGNATHLEYLIGFLSEHAGPNAKQPVIVKTLQMMAKTP